MHMTVSLLLECHGKFQMANTVSVMPSQAGVSDAPTGGRNHRRYPGHFGYGDACQRSARWGD
jgi:hypothetical protein